MSLIPSSLIEVRRTQGKGRGVFARAPIGEGTVIERAPVLVIPAIEVDENPYDTVIARYCFQWGAKSVAVVLGYGSLYNHSYRPNAYYRDRRNRVKEFIALRDIKPGEEITINYNGSPHDRTDVGFEAT
ncbi:MAG: SET domain-containing protein [Planctomycetes bacterium]|nr:SET domain-containing protein [Planctomycetota bacterium]